MKKVPQSLKYWFQLHFILDVLFALPLMFFPEQTLSFFGFLSPDPFLARLVAAALIGIGTTSLINKESSVDSYNSLLNLKLIWSSSAVLGMLLSLENAPTTIWLLISIFSAFFFVWLHYKIKLAKS